MTSIEGDGDGEDMAYIDEHDITDVPSMDDAMTDDDLETTEVVIDDDLDELDLAEDLAINDDLNDIDLIGFDDSSLA